MLLSRLFSLYTPQRIGYSAALFNHDIENVAKYQDFAAQIANEPESGPTYILEKDESGDFRIAGLPDSVDVFKLMPVKEFANLHTGVILLKFRDAVNLLNEFVFFRI